MGIIAWIIFGLIAGIIAKVIMPGKDPGGIIVTSIIGILGAVVGGWIGTQLGFGDVTGFNLASFVIAVLGAIILLILYRVVRRYTPRRCWR
ncbi:GlsB/YeaQ/YmgE family stress response membrane protein [Cobetia sp. ICG0124]|nr:GlsB/YeaQ/YmgE family stress response membrane protein [Cobetia sp. ICG0124]AZV30744.1 GlsB/YeaQ/YmgE family stress response membrane protein [Cobetia sp. ICG0124]